MLDAFRSLLTHQPFPISEDAVYLFGDEGKTLSDKLFGVLTHRLEVETFDSPAFVDRKLRLVKPQLCDGTVQQYSGYLDISETRHLFFW